MNTLETKLNKLNAQLKATHRNRTKNKLIIKFYYRLAYKLRFYQRALA